MNPHLTTQVLPNGLENILTSEILPGSTNRGIRGQSLKNLDQLMYFLNTKYVPTKIFQSPAYKIGETLTKTIEKRKSNVLHFVSLTQFSNTELKKKLWPSGKPFLSDIEWVSNFKGLTMGWKLK